MSIYLDANMLIHYCLGLEEGRMDRVLSAEDVAPLLPAPVTDILRLEVRNGIERMVYESRHGNTFRVTPEAAAAAQAVFDDLLDNEVLLQRVKLCLAEVAPEFDMLALRHTAAHGFRTYDILHVASALELNCARFYSFDRKANELARLEGLETI